MLSVSLHTSYVEFDDASNSWVEEDDDEKRVWDESESKTCVCISALMESCENKRVETIDIIEYIRIYG